MDLRHTEEREGFTIKLYTTPELEQPDWDMTEDELEQLLYDINSGELKYFCAKVTAEKLGIKLASDYLGGCCYKSIEIFMQPDGYYPEMVNTVLQEAKKTLASLCD